MKIKIFNLIIEINIAIEEENKGYTIKKGDLYTSIFPSERKQKWLRKVFLKKIDEIKRSKVEIKYANSKVTAIKELRKIITEDYSQDNINSLTISLRDAKELIEKWGY